MTGLEESGTTNRPWFRRRRSALERLARKAAVDAARLDELDAPRVELARQKKERDDGRVVAEKARGVSKAAFRP